MQVVIDIPEEVKEVFDKAKEDDLKGSYYDYNSIIGKAIQNGTPLPKGHGRLIDARVFEATMYHQAFETDSDMQKWDSGCWIRYKMFENEICDAPTILEADKEIANENTT